jgi:hypothetical protein
LKQKTKIYLVKVSDRLDRKVEIFIDDQDDDEVADTDTDVPDADFEED